MPQKTTMNPYFLVIIGDILLAVTFLFQKKYQKVAGTAIKANLVYNALMGVFSALTLFFINKFSLNITLFSFITATIIVVAVLLYTYFGFKLMEKGNMSIYTLFLMSGGMTVPYIYGVMFLNENLTWLRTIGLFIILAGIVLSNANKTKTDKKQILMCIAVFFFNGVTSVTMKIHQINPASQIVTSSDFALLVALLKAVICTIVLLIKRKQFTDSSSIQAKPRVFLPIVFLAATADAVSYLAQLIGATKLPATVLYPMVTGGCIILTSLAGVIFYKEKLSAKQWISVGICFIGTLLFL